MAHGITKKDSMFSVQEVPWHGLGTVLERQPKSIDEALRKSGLTWKVVQKPIFLPNTKTPIDGFKANVRSDTGDVLGIVTDTYEVIQTQQALQFLEALMGELPVQTLGSLWGGKQVFATCRLPEHIEVGGDRIDPFVCMNTRHDGLGALQAYTTPIRQVCANTVRMALNAAIDKVSIRHIGDPSQQVAQARQVLNMTVDYYKQFAKTGNKLASQKMTERKLAQVMDALWPQDAALGGRAMRNNVRKRELVHAIVSGKTDTVGNAPGSKWAAWNALVEVHDHNGRSRTPEGAFVRKVEDPTGFKRRALDMVVAA